MKLVVLMLVALGLAFAQQEAPPQVEGFPPFTPPAPMFTVLEEIEGGYLVSHAQSETVVPKNPRRIVALELITAEALISLSVQPVGLASPWLPEVVAEAAPEMTFLRTTQDLNLEAILALEPDLIIGYRLVGEDPNLYEQLSRIAPTVVPHDEVDAYWQQYTHDLAGLLGIPGRAEEMTQRYNDAVTDYRERAQTVVGKESINIALVFPRSLWLYAPGYMLNDHYIPLVNSSWPYIELGLEPSSEMVRILGTEPYAEILFEVLPELRAEHLIVLYDGAETPDERAELETTLQTFTDHPLWERVRAVQEGNVYLVPRDRPTGYYTTLEVLEQFDAALHGETAL